MTEGDSKKLLNALMQIKTEQSIPDSCEKLYDLFQNLQKAGFNETQAFELLKITMQVAAM